MDKQPIKDQKNRQKESDLALHMESLVVVDNPDDFEFEGDFKNTASGTKDALNRKEGFTRFDNPDDIDANRSKT